MDYFDWADRKNARPKAAGSEPLAHQVDELSLADDVLVQEHHASTSVIAKVREQLYDMLRRR